MTQLQTKKLPSTAKGGYVLLAFLVKLASDFTKSIPVVFTSSTIARHNIYIDNQAPSTASSYLTIFKTMLVHLAWNESGI